MTKAQKVVGIVVASGITILTYTGYNNHRDNMVIKSGANNGQLKSETASTSAQRKADKADKTYTNHAAQAKYTSGYNNPMSYN